MHNNHYLCWYKMTMCIYNFNCRWSRYVHWAQWMGYCSFPCYPPCSSLQLLSWTISRCYFLSYAQEKIPILCFDSSVSLYSNCFSCSVNIYLTSRIRRKSVTWCDCTIISSCIPVDGFRTVTGIFRYLPIYR